MQDHDLAKFTEQLRDILSDLANQDELGEEGQKTVVLDQQSVGRLSRMDALQGQAMARATAARRDALSLRVKAALNRIEDGEFGYCEDCGEDIARKRLQLDPTATRCISCANG